MTKASKLPEDILQIKKKLQTDGFLTITIVSDSMHPVLKVGKSYNLLPIEELHQPSKYDILAYWDGEKIIGHYFYEESKLFNDEEVRWIFKSIVSRGEDFPVSKDYVLGRIQTKIPAYIRAYLAIKNRLNI